MKAILIEDRPDRQRIFLSNNEKDVQALMNIQDLLKPNGQECREIIDKINNEDYDFQDIKLIMVHKSSLTTKGLNFVNNHSKAQKTAVAYFSGGIDQLLYNNENFECLNINSKDFYSYRLIPFINNFTANKYPHILELSNENWKLSYMFLIKQLVNNHALEANDDEKFNLEVRIDQIKLILNIENKLNNGITEYIDKEISKIVINL